MADACTFPGCTNDLPWPRASTETLCDPHGLAVAFVAAADRWGYSDMQVIEMQGRNDALEVWAACQEVRRAST